jgi:hypothetical protein
MPHVVVERYEQIAHQPHEEVAALGAFGLQNSDRHSIGHAPPRRWIARSITPRATPDRTSSLIAESRRLVLAAISIRLR